MKTFTFPEGDDFYFRRKIQLCYIYYDCQDLKQQLSNNYTGKKNLIKPEHIFKTEPFYYLRMLTSGVILLTVGFSLQVNCTFCISFLVFPCCKVTDTGPFLLFGPVTQTISCPKEILFKSRGKGKTTTIKQLFFKSSSLRHLTNPFWVSHLDKGKEFQKERIRKISCLRNHLHHPNRCPIVGEENTAVLFNLFLLSGYLLQSNLAWDLALLLDYSNFAQCERERIKKKCFFFSQEKMLPIKKG